MSQSQPNTEYYRHKENLGAKLSIVESHEDGEDAESDVLHLKGRVFIAQVLGMNLRNLDDLREGHGGALLGILDGLFQTTNEAGEGISDEQRLRLQMYLDGVGQDEHIAQAETPEVSPVSVQKVRRERTFIKRRLGAAAREHREVARRRALNFVHDPDGFMAKPVEPYPEISEPSELLKKRQEIARRNSGQVLRRVVPGSPVTANALTTYFLTVDKAPTSQQMKLLQRPLRAISEHCADEVGAAMRRNEPLPTEALKTFQIFVGSLADEVAPVSRAEYSAVEARIGTEIAQDDIEIWQVLRWLFVSDN